MPFGYKLGQPTPVDPSQEYSIESVDPEAGRLRNLDLIGINYDQSLAGGDDMLAEQDKIRSYLNAKAGGSGLEANRLAEQSRRDYTGNVRSAAASAVGRYDPNMARTAERQASAAPMVGRSEQRINALAESQQAGAMRSDFDTQAVAANQDYWDSRQAYESAINNLNQQMTDLRQSFVARGYSAEEATRSAAQALRGTQQVGQIAQLRNDARLAEQRRASVFGAFSSILGGMQQGANVGITAAKGY